MNAEMQRQLRMFAVTSDWHFREAARLISQVQDSPARERQLTELRRRNQHVLRECERFMERNS